MVKMGSVWLGFGADLKSSFEASRNAQTFNLPQAVWYFHAKLSDQVEAVFSSDFSQTKESYGLVKLGEGVVVKAGFFTLPYGLLVAEPRSLLATASGFGPYVQDMGVEVDVSGKGGSSQWFVRNAITNGTGVGNRVRADTVQAGLQWDRALLGVSSQFHHGETGDRWRYGTFGWLSLLPFAVLWELDGGRDPVTDAIPFLWHGRLEWDAFTDFHFSVVHELWDPDLAVTNDHRQRMEVAARWFPLPYTELVVSVAVLYRPSFEDAYEGAAVFHIFY